MDSLYHFPSTQAINPASPQHLIPYIRVFLHKKELDQTHKSNTTALKGLAHLRETVKGNPRLDRNK